MPDSKTPTTLNTRIFGVIPIALIGPTGETTLMVSPTKAPRRMESSLPRMIPGRVGSDVPTAGPAGGGSLGGTRPGGPRAGGRPDLVFFGPSVNAPFLCGS